MSFIKNLFLHKVDQAATKKPINNLAEMMTGGRPGDLGNAHSNLNPNREEERLVMEMRARMEADNARTLAKRNHRFYD